jgi:hypothetical protein
VAESRKLGESLRYIVGWRSFHGSSLRCDIDLDILRLRVFLHANRIFIAEVFVLDIKDTALRVIILDAVLVSVGCGAMVVWWYFSWLCRSKTWGWDKEKICDLRCSRRWAVCLGIVAIARVA